MVLQDSQANIGGSGARKRRLKRMRIGIPGNFAAEAVSDSSIRLTWDTPTGLYVDEYRITRNGVEAVVVPAVFLRVYDDNGLTAETLYEYEIRAHNRFNGMSLPATASTTTLTSG